MCIAEKYSRGQQRQMSSGQTLGVKAQRFRGHTSPHRNVKEKKEGETVLYQDGHLVWRTQRGKSEVIPSGGSLVIGREQDCRGGCFDSTIGASGDVDTGLYNRQESQDFYGLMDDMRLWNRTLSAKEVFIHYEKDALRFLKSGQAEQKNNINIMNTTGLVANWMFDEGEGFTVKDMSGNGNDLYISGNPVFEPMMVESECGNGVVELGESCDDSDLISTDGCDEFCRVEFGWTCVGSPSVCTVISSLPRCGDGKMEGVEQCDDGNTVSGDGCSQSCHVEQDWECLPTSPSKCNFQGRKFKLDGVLQAERAVPQESLDNNSSSSSSKKSGGLNPAVYVIIAMAALILIILVSFVVFRQRIYEQFPWVERKIQDIDGSFRRFRNPVQLDLDDLDKAAEPVNTAAQGSSYQPPASGEIAVKAVVTDAI
eukprot:TRINITY_DN12210_c0_g2_i5.p1 TRINITY_DN12210_c0_g2~~TRINITY_DN12210_c0_g2_i5.p1  ORF type:complete len:425 (-),score=110.66 TRINITY_DN12210_c0_g2_i5:156-1430(-)